MHHNTAFDPGATKQSKIGVATRHIKKTDVAIATPVGEAWEGCLRWNDFDIYYP